MSVLFFLLQFKFSFHLPDSLTSILSQSSLASERSLPQVQEEVLSIDTPRIGNQRGNTPEWLITTPFSILENETKIKNSEDLGNSVLQLHTHASHSKSFISVPNQFLYNRPDFLSNSTTRRLSTTSLSLIHISLPHSILKHSMCVCSPHLCLNLDL